MSAGKKVSTSIRTAKKASGKLFGPGKGRAKVNAPSKAVRTSVKKVVAKPAKKAAKKAVMKTMAAKAPAKRRARTSTNTVAERIRKRVHKPSNVEGGSRRRSVRVVEGRNDLGDPRLWAEKLAQALGDHAERYALASEADPPESLGAGDRVALSEDPASVPKHSMGREAAVLGPYAEEKRLYLIRPSKLSAAKALSASRVEMNQASRGKQLDLLREFRNDTHAFVVEACEWLRDETKGAVVTPTTGMFSPGLVVAMTPDAAERLRREDPGVVIIENRALSIVEPLQVVISETGLSRAACWHLEAVGLGTSRPGGRPYTGQGVHVAILDTGVDLDHPEFGGRVREGWKTMDGARGWTDPDDLIRDENHRDTSGHGTHVAGLICGTHVGVAPGASATSVLMMPHGMATTFDFIRCLTWAGQNRGVSLVNFSAGERPFNDDMMPIIEDLMIAGVLPFCAVGNDGPNTSHSPGNYSVGISVGAVDAPRGQTVSAFSGSAQITYDNTIYPVPDLVAPGGDVHSSYRGGLYATSRGTSMATPIACGVAACLLEHTGGSASPEELVELLRRSCITLDGVPAARQGWGLVQAP